MAQVDLLVNTIFKVSGLNESIAQAQRQISSLRTAQAALPAGSPQVGVINKEIEGIQKGLQAQIVGGINQSISKFQDLGKAVSASGIDDALITKLSNAAVRTQKMLSDAGDVLGVSAERGLTSRLTKAVKGITGTLAAAGVTPERLSPLAAMETKAGRVAAIPTLMPERPTTSRAEARAEARSASQAELDQINTQLAQASKQQLESKVRGIAVEKEHQAALIETKAGSKQYVDAVARVRTASAELAAAEQQAMIATREETGEISRYAAARASMISAQAAEEAQIQRSLLAEGEYATSKAEAAAASAALAVEIQREIQAEGTLATSEAELAALKAVQAAQTQSLLAGDTAVGVQYRKATLEDAVAKEQLAMVEKEALATDVRAIEASARLANAEEERAARLAVARESLVRTGTIGEAATMSREDALTRAAMIQHTAALRKKTAALNVASEEEIQAMVLQRFANRQQSVAMAAREKEMVRTLTATGELGGTRFQRLYGSATGKMPTEVPTAGQFVGTKALTLAGYATAAIPAMAVFSLTKTLKESIELEQVWAKLQAAWVDAGRGDQFEGFRGRIKEISVETGQSVKDVIAFYVRVAGVFNDPARALKETESAMKLATVTGMNMSTMLTDLLPVAQTFGVSIEEIGNMALYMRARFGVAEEAAVSYFGVFAPAAKQAGLSFAEMAALGGSAAAAIGKPMSAIGDQLSKTFQTMTQNAVKFTAVFRASAATEGLAKPFAEAIGAGETGEAFKLLLANFDQLDKAQQNQIIRLSGGKREWATLTALYANSADVLRSMAGAEDDVASRGDLLQKRFDTVSGTVNTTIERVRQGFASLVEDLANLGALDVAGALVGGFGLVFAAIEKVMGALRGLNEMTGGVAGTMLTPFIEFALVALAAQKALNFYRSTVTMAGDAKKALTKITQQAIGTETQDTVVKSANATATQRVLTVEAEEAIARANASAAAERETMVDGQNTTGKLANAGATEKTVAAETLGMRARLASGATGMLQGIQGGVTRQMPALSRAGLFGRQSQAAAGSWAAAGQTGAAGQTAGIMSGGAGFVMPAMIAVFAAAQVNQVREEWSNRLRAQGDKLKVAMKDRTKATDEELKQVVKEQDDWQSSLYETIFREDMPGTLAAKELTRRQNEPAIKAIEAQTQTPGLLKKTTETMTQQTFDNIALAMQNNEEYRSLANDLGVMDQNVGEKVLSFVTRGHMGEGKVQVNRGNYEKLKKDLRDRINNGDERAMRFATVLDQMEARDQALIDARKQMDEAVKKQDLAQAAALAGGAYLEPAQLEAQVNRGERTRGSMLGTLRKNLETTKGLLEGARAQGDQEQIKAYQDQYDQEAQRIETEIQNFNQARTDFLVFMATSTRPEEAKTAEYQTRLQQLKSLRPEQQWAKSFEMLQLGYGSWQEQLKAQNLTPQQRAEKQQSGWTVPDETRIGMLAQQLSTDQGVAEVINTLLANLTINDIEFYQKIAERVIKTRCTVADAMMAVYNDYAKREENRVTISGTQWQQINIAFGSISAPPTTVGGVFATPLTAEETEKMKTPEGRRDPGLRAKYVTDKMTQDQAVMDWIGTALSSMNIGAEEFIKLVAERVVASGGTVADAMWAVFNEHLKGPGATGFVVRPTTEQINVDVPAEVPAGAAEVQLMESELQQRSTARALEAAKRPKDTRAQLQKNIDDIQDKIDTKKAELGKPGTDADALNKQIADLEVEKQNAINAMADRDDQIASNMDEWAEIRARHDPIGRARAKYQRSLNDIQRAKDRGATPEDIIELEQQADENWHSIQDAEDEQAMAMAKWAEVYARSDPIKQAQARVQLAALAIEQARAQGVPENSAEMQGLLQQHQIALYQQQEADANANISYMNYMASANESDPVAAARAQLDIANQQVTNAVALGKGDGAKWDAMTAARRAQRTLDEANANANIAYLRYQQTLHAADPVQAARDALRIADQQLSDAQRFGKGDQAIWDARGAQLEAQRRLQEAISASTTNSANMLIAILNSQDYSVEAAKVALEDAKRRLLEAQQRGATEEVKQLTGEVASLSRSALDAEVADAEDVTNFMLEMGQITVSQAIARLQVEAAKYRTGSKAWRDLQLKIHSLQQQSTADLQFNLPSNIALPTLYEARRMNQSYMMGIGYNDARQVNVTVNVNGAQDTMAVSNQVVGAITSAMSTGTTYSPGVLVGGR